ncbi:MAG: type II secretion system protein [Phycisphaerae bacterium]
MSSTPLSVVRPGRARSAPAAFTLIELLVVVAIIALLISILLPSLNKARDQAKAAVCATRLRTFGQASALYEGEFKSFTPCDPWWMMPEVLNSQLWRQRNWQDRVDPSHGWLALFGLDIKPTPPPSPGRPCPSASASSQW